jgi:hypothetical protein
MCECPSRACATFNGVPCACRVICVFHAQVTLLRWKEQLKLFEIVEPSTIKEASKTEKVRHKFRPTRMRTRTFIVSFSLRANLGIDPSTY